MVGARARGDHGDSPIDHREIVRVARRSTSKCSADRAHHHIARAHVERPLRVMRDFEQRFTLQQLDDAMVVFQPHLDLRCRVQRDARPSASSTERCSPNFV